MCAEYTGAGTQVPASCKTPNGNNIITIIIIFLYSFFLAFTLLPLYGLM